MAGAVGVTSEMASRMVRDLLISGGRQAAVAEAEARQHRLQRGAGSTLPMLLPSRRSQSTGLLPVAAPSRGSGAGPSAPPPRGWTSASGVPSGDPGGSSTLDGNPADAALAKKRRAEARQRAQDGRDNLAVESGLSFCEEKAVRPQSTPGYQRAFLMVLAFLATLGTWPVTKQQVSPQDFRKIAESQPDQLDGSMCDYFDWLYFSGSMAHEAEKAKAAVLHYTPSLSAVVDLPRMTRALQGFRKVSPGSSRFPLPWEILGALVGWLSAYGHGEMALALLVMFTAYLRPSELFMPRICDFSCLKDRWLVNLAPGDTGVLTKTGLQDEAIYLDNQLFPAMGRALKQHIKDLGYNLTTMRRATQSMWTFSLALFRQTVQKGAEELGLPDGFCLYMARHGGVSADILLGYREWLESKTRGRWHSDTTHKRYCKQGLLTRYLQFCPKEVVEFGETVMGDKEQLLQIVLGHKMLTAPRVQPHKVKKVTRVGPVPASRPSAQPGIFLKLTGEDQAENDLALPEPSVKENLDRAIVPVEPMKKTTPMKAKPMKKTTPMKAVMKKTAPMKATAMKLKVMKVAIKIMKSAPMKVMKAPMKMKAARRKPARLPTRAPVRRRPAGRRR